MTAITPVGTTLKFVEILNTFDLSKRKLSDVSFTPGQAISDIWPESLTETDKFVYALNGKVLEEADLAVTFPRADDFVSKMPVVAGGEDTKMIVRLVAIIVVSIYAPGWGTALATSIGSTSVAVAAAFTVAINVGAALVVNALLPPPKQDFGSNDGERGSTTYGIDGPKNTSAEGIVVPVVYGQHRYGGNIIGNYVVNEGEQQILHLLICAGEGPIAGIGKIELNDQPLETYTGTDTKIVTGTEDQEPIGWFVDNTVPFAINQILSTTYKLYTTSGEVDRLRLDFLAPNGLFYAEDNGTLRQTSVNLQVDFRLEGTTDWFPMASTSVVEGRLASAVYHRVARFDEGGGPRGNIIYVPDGTETIIDGLIYDINDRMVGHIAEEGEYNPATSFQVSGSSRTPLRRSFYTEPLPEGIYEIRYRRSGEPATDVRISDSVVLLEVNEITTERVAYRGTAALALQVKINEQLNNMPTVTFLHGGKLIKVWNEATQEFEERSSSNPAWITWDILTNSRYGGGASFSRLDLAKWKDWANFCDEKGFEFHGVFDTQSNVWEAANAAARCGRGQIIMVGTRYSVVIEREDSPTMMFSVANMEAGSFSENWLGLSDRANEIEISFADKNDNYRQRTIKVFDQEAFSAGLPARSASLVIQGLVDAERAYVEADLMIKMNKHIQRTVSFVTPLEAVSCVVGDLILVQNDMPQWGYGGRFEAGSTLQNIKLDRVVPFEPGFEYAILVHYPSLMRLNTTIFSVSGDLVILDGYTGTVYEQMRLKTASGLDVEVFDVIEQERSSAFGNSLPSLYGVRVTDTTGLAAGLAVSLWQNNAMVTRSVTNQATGLEVIENDTLFSAALPQAPAQFDKWMYGKVTKVSKPFRVKSITSGSADYNREITAIEYNEAIYAGPGAVIPDLDYSDLNGRYVQQPTILGIRETLVIQGGVIVPQVTVGFSSGQSTYTGAALLVSFNGGAWEEKGRNFSQVSFLAAESDVLRLRFIAYDRFGNSTASALTQFTTYTVLGKTAPPLDVTNLAATIKLGVVEIIWDASTELDYLDTELRVGESWEAGSPLVEPGPTRVPGSSFVRARPANGTYRVWAAHRDTSLNYSVNKASITVIVDNTIDGSSDGGLSIATDAFAFIFQNPDAVTSASPNINFEARGVVGSVAWLAQAYDVTQNIIGNVPLSGTGNSRSMSAAQFNSVNPTGTNTRYVKVTATFGGFTDTVTIFRGDSGGDALNMVLGNEMHNVPTAYDGTGGDFTYATTQFIQVYRGITDETGLWSFQIFPYSCTALINGAAGPISGAANVNLVVSAMSDDFARVDIVATRPGFPTQSTTFKLNKIRAAAPFISARLSANELIFKTPADSVTPAPAQVTLTATSSGLVGPVYEWYVDDVLQVGQVNPTFVLPSFPTGPAKRVRVVVFDETITESAEDVVSIYSFKDGSDSINAGLDNENQTVACDGTGTPLAGALPLTAQVYVVRGINFLSSGVTYAIQAGSNIGFGGTPTVSATGLLTIPAIANDYASIIVTATVGSVTIPMRFTANKSTAGANGTRTATLQLFRWSSTPPVMFPSGTSVYTWATGSFSSPVTPNGWSLIQGDPTPGQTLYAIRQVITDNSTNPTSLVSWTSNTPIPVGAAGVDGAMGSRAGFVFVRSATTPPTPIGTAHIGWFDAPPAANGNPLWTSIANIDEADQLIGVWGAPIKIEGDGIYVEYSVNGSSLWHPVFTAGDLFARHKTGVNGAWSASFRIVGEMGPQGPQGIQGPTGPSGAAVIRPPLAAFSKSVSPPIYSSSPWNGATDDLNATNLVWQLLGTTGGGGTGSAPSNAHLRIGDKVTLSTASGTTVDSRYWGGSSWLSIGAEVSGNAIVSGTISGGTNIEIFGYARVEGGLGIGVVMPFSGSAVSRTAAGAFNTTLNQDFGVVGYSNQSNGNGAGVYGFNSNTVSGGIGVAGRGRTGVHGISSTAGGVGVYGESSSGGGSGVFGSGGGAGTFGVHGVTSFLGGGVAVRADALSGGTALQVLGVSTFSNRISVAGQIVSTTAAAPFVVSSTVLVPNLNVNYLGNFSASYFLDRANHTGAVPAASSIPGSITGAVENNPFVFNSNNKPSGNAGNDWLTFLVAGAGYYAVPAWSRLF